MRLVKILSVTAAVLSIAACTSNQAPSVQASSSEAGASTTSSFLQIQYSLHLIAAMLRGITNY